MTEEDWKSVLSRVQFAVTRKQGTEPAFNGHLWNNKQNGIYHCICCDTKLFSSSTKFDSGTGWPSFHSAEGSNTVGENADRSHGMVRVEVRYIPSTTTVMDKNAKAKELAIHC